MARPTQEETMDFLTAIVGEEVRAIDEDLGGGYVRLAVSEAARRQARHDIRWVEDIVIELLRNARDAQATHIYIATTREANRRLIVALDDGVGIDHDMWEQVFEPRVTSKLETIHIDEWGIHGRGMALYSIRENAKVAQVRASQKGRGSALFIEVDTAALAERADQSSMPTTLVSDGEVRFRGPHNIARAVVEFAQLHPDLEVHLGSMAEIVSAIRQSCVSDWIADPLVTANDAARLSDYASGLGLEISERSAYRILNGQVTPAARVISPSADPATPGRGDGAAIPVHLEKDARGLRIAEADLASFRLDLEKAFDRLAEAYYLDLRDSVRIKQSGDTIKVTFTFDKQ